MKIALKIIAALFVGFILAICRSKSPANSLSPIAHTKALTAAQPFRSPSAPALSDQTSLFLKEEAARMNRTDPNPAEAHRKLEEKASSLSEAQSQGLGEMVIDTNAPLNERLLGLYLLRLNKNTPSEIFERIALLEEITTGHNAPPVETALAFSALEELGLRSLENREEIARLVKIGRLTKNPSLAYISPKLIHAASLGKPFYLEVRK